MGIIAKYKFNNTLADLLPEFNSEFTSDLYTVTDEVNGEVTTRTIESDTLPTLMRFGIVSTVNIYATDRELSLLEVIDMNTNELTTAHSMFRRCQNLTKVDCSWNTSKITTMHHMFNECRSLSSLDTSEWDTSKVTTLRSAFSQCNSLTELDVSDWDVGNVSNMGYVFYATSIGELDVSNWNMGEVTDIACMFAADGITPSLITSLDVSKWNTSKVTNMASVFYNCNMLTSLDVSNWNTSKVTTMREMFESCKNLTTLDVSNFDTANVTQMNATFNGCSKLTSLDVSNFDTANVTSMGNMFNNCSSLTSLDVSKFNTSNVTNMGNMFKNCYNLTVLDVSNFDTSNVTNMVNIFYGCNKLTSLDVSNWDTSNVTDMSAMFQSCNTLKYLKCSNVNTLNTLNTHLPTKTSDNPGTIICKSDITNLDTTTLSSKYWNIIDELTLVAKYVFDKSIHNNCIPEFNTEFEGYFIEDEVVEGSNEVTRTIESCGMLPTLMRFGRIDTSSSSLLKILDMDTSALTSMWGMFSYCNNLTSVSCNWNTTLVTDMWAVFSSCNKLTSVDVSNWDTSNVNNMNYLFGSCANLSTLDVSNWDTSNVTTMYQMFYNCNNLTSLDISNFNTNKVTDITDIFTNTPLLADIGVLYMDKSSLQKLVNAMPTDLNKTLWYKDVDINGITHGNNITLKKYIEENVEIVLNNPLLEGDRIEIKDGKLCHYHRYGMVVLDGSEDEGWGLNNTFYFTTNIRNIKKSNIQDMILCDTLQPTNNITANTPEKIGIYIVGQLAQIRIRIDSINSNPVQWLSENPTTVVYELAEPYYEDVTPLQSSIALRTFEECNIQIITALPIKTKITYRTNITSAIVMEQELDTLDSGVSLSNLIEEEVNE